MSLATRLAEVHDATAALTRAAERADADAVAAAVEARGRALAALGAWFGERGDPESRTLQARIAGELESGLVEARAALARMRDTARASIDGVREALAVRGYAGGDATRKSAALDRAG